MAHIGTALLALLFALLAVGCVGTGTGTGTATEDVPVSPGAAGESIATTADTEEGTPASGSSGCLGNAAIGDIRGEYAANPFRAVDRYTGQMMCLEGKIVGFYEDVDYLGVEVEIEDDWIINFYKPKPSSTVRPKPSYEVVESEWRAEWAEWEKWIMSVSSVGDKVFFDCRIGGLVEPGDGWSLSPGTPYFRRCDPKSAEGGMVFMPTAGPAPTPTPYRSPTPWPTGTPLPCETVEFVDGKGIWLEINCPENTVIFGRPTRSTWKGEVRYRPYGEGGPSTVSYSLGQAGITYYRSEYTKWQRRADWVEKTIDELLAEGIIPQDVADEYKSDGIEVGEIIETETWEAPPEVAAHIIEGWRTGVPLLILSLHTDHIRMGAEFVMRERP